jgi:hypothetical protein
MAQSPVMPTNWQKSGSLSVFGSDTYPWHIHNSAYFHVHISAEPPNLEPPSEVHPALDEKYLFARVAHLSGTAARHSIL